MAGVLSLSEPAPPGLSQESNNMTLPGVVGRVAEVYKAPRRVPSTQHVLRCSHQYDAGAQGRRETKEIRDAKKVTVLPRKNETETRN